MAEKFDVCVAADVQSPSERESILAKFAGVAAPLIANPVWMMRVRGAEVVECDWHGGPIEVPEGWVVCLYPKTRSSSHGAWILEVIGRREVWTLSLPKPLVDSNMPLIIEVIWGLSVGGVPCIAGREYSMAAICRAGGDVEAEAGKRTSLASHAVLRAGRTLPGWSSTRTDGNRVLLVRGERSE
jgi:hypothetical protein